MALGQAAAPIGAALDREIERRHSNPRRSRCIHRNSTALLIRAAMVAIP